MENREQKIKLMKERHAYLRRVVLLLFSFIVPLVIFAQSKSFHGTVKDTQDEPIIGAYVKIKGTDRGTLTDINGNFTIEAASQEKIVISYLGYVNQEITAGNQTNLQITLAEDNTQLDEVVVVGYGTQKKASLTGAISAVSSKDINVTKNENVVNMLTGKLPGVRISQASSRPGAFDTQIDIRGMGEPLIVVDGVPRDKDYFSRMDANEIESISVLKDASAAIYGLRSANGVLLVTTKRGEFSKAGFDITYSANVGWQQFLHTPSNIDALQYMALVNEKKWRDFNDNYMSKQAAPYGEAQMKPYQDGTKRTVDWMNAIFKKTTPQQQHNLTVSGGTEKVSYFFNLGYMKQDGALKSGSMDYDRWNFRTSVDANITKNLKTQLTLGGYMDEMNEPRTDIWSIYKKAWLQRPTTEIYANGNPDYLNSKDLNEDNPMAATNSSITGYRKFATKVFNGQLAISYDIPQVKGLTAKASYSYDFKSQDNTDYQKSYYLYEYDNVNDIYRPTEKNSPSSVRRQSYPDYKTLMQLSLNYRRTFLDVHNVSALALYEEEYTSWDSFYAYRQIKVNSEYLFAGESDKQEGGMYGIGDRSAKAVVGKFNYDFKGKYLAEFSFRYDGSSKFPKNKRWGFFPSASIGWRLSEESFIKNNLLFVNNLKVRASYGKMGDDRDAANYPPNIIGYEIDGDNLGWIYGGSLVAGAKPTAIPNPNLTWYTAKTMDIGLDVELWNGLLGGSVDYFQRDRDGLIAKRNALIPGTVGAALPEENLESDRTFGLEFVLTHRHKIGDVSYYINGQISTTKNKWKTKMEERAGNSYDNWRNRLDNRNKDIWWGKTYGGRFINYDQIYNHNVAVGAGSAVPGDYYYVDWNGDGVINDKDNHPIATYGMPLINYGITLGAEWRGLDLSMNFQGAADVYVRYTEALAEPLSFGNSGTMDKFWDRWRPANPDADIFDPSTQWISGYYPMTGSPLAEGTRAIENASYLRLKTIELGYSFPKKWLTRVGVKGLRVYVSGYNLLTFTGLKDMDPEHPGGEVAGGKESIDGYKYPINKTFNVGASVKF